MSRTVATLSMLVVAATVLAACGGSSQTAAATPTVKVGGTYATPPGRQGAAMAYDPDLREVIMFGGGTQSTPLNDTWAWDGKGWAQLHPGHTPSGGTGLMAYDAASKALLLFPAVGGSWKWQNGDWVKTDAVPTPSCATLANGQQSCASPVGQYPQYLSGLAYNETLEKLVVLSGPTTWTWDGTKWAYLGALNNTNANCFCLVYDRATRQVLTLAFSGGKLSPAVGHTLVFNGSGWIVAASLAPVVTQALWAYDEASSSVLLIAMNDNYGSPVPPSMWSWDGSSWHQLSISIPPVLTNASLAGDAAHRQLVLFGGIDPYGSPSSDTWLFDGKAWTKSS